MSVLLLIFLLLLVVINGLFVAAEFALVRARRSRLEAMAGEGTRGAEQALVQLDRIDESLSACQVGITMASIGIGFLGEPSLARLIEPIFGGLSHGVAVAISVAIAFTLVTSHPHRARRAGAEDTGDHPGGGHGPGPGPAAGGVPRRSAARSRSA